MYFNCVMIFLIALQLLEIRMVSFFYLALTPSGEMACSRHSTLYLLNDEEHISLLMTLAFLGLFLWIFLWRPQIVPSPCQDLFKAPT